MSLDANARADAISGSIIASSPKMSTDDQNRLRSGLRQFMAADTSYLTQHAEITPGSLAAAAGIPVSTTGSPAAQSGSSTAPGPLTSTGRGGLT